MNKKKLYGIFYQVNGKTFALYTHLGCASLSTRVINIFEDKKLVEDYYQRAIKMSWLTEFDKLDYTCNLKPEYRGGRAFIARVGSKNFPANILDPIKIFEGWHLRAKCEIVK